MIDIFIMLFLGIFLGIITGLIPGVHINLISVLILYFSPSLLIYTTPLHLGVMIIAMAITHTFLDTIPSIFLGAPDATNALIVLPGHRLLLEGKGYQALVYTVIGSLGGLILALFFVPLLLLLVQWIYPLLKNYIGFFLIIILCILFYREQKSKILALIFFFFAGALGIGVLNFPLIKEPLFPLLSGLFGISMLIVSIYDNVKIPKQELTCEELNPHFHVITTSFIVGWLCSFMPGLGPSQAAALSSPFIKKSGDKGFLILVGGLSTVNMVLSLVTLYVLEKARNGAVIVVSKLVPQLSLITFLLFLTTALIAGGIATLLALFLSQIFLKIIQKVHYRILCVLIIIFIMILIFFISGPWGIFIVIIATSLGILTHFYGIAKHYLMGCLLVPTILYFIL